MRRRRRNRQARLRSTSVDGGWPRTGVREGVKGLERRLGKRAPRKEKKAPGSEEPGALEEWRRWGEANPRRALRTSPQRSPRGLPRNRPERLGVVIPPHPLLSRPVPVHSAGSCDIRATWRGPPLPLACSFVAVGARWHTPNGHQDPPGPDLIGGRSHAFPSVHRTSALCLSLRYVSAEPKRASGPGPEARQPPASGDAALDGRGAVRRPRSFRALARAGGAVLSCPRP